MAKKNVDKNNTKVFFPSWWKHIEKADFICVPPFTPMDKLIHQLSSISNKNYDGRWFIVIKQFYHRFLNTKENKSKKTCQGWTVDYLVNNKYVRLIDETDINPDTLLLPKNQSWVHEFFPLIEKINLKTPIFCTELIFLLNEKIKLPDYKDFSEQIMIILKNNSQVFEAQKKIQDYHTKIDQLQSIEKISKNDFFSFRFFLVRFRKDPNFKAHI